MRTHLGCLRGGFHRADGVAIRCRTRTRIFLPTDTGGGGNEGPQARRAGRGFSSAVAASATTATAAFAVADSVGFLESFVDLLELEQSFLRDAAQELPRRLPASRIVAIAGVLAVAVETGTGTGTAAVVVVDLILANKPTFVRSPAVVVFRLCVDGAGRRRVHEDTWGRRRGIDRRA